VIPSIYILARPSFTSEYKRFLRIHHFQWKESRATVAERLTEFAGRICYLSFGKRQSPRKNFDYIANLIKRGHESVFEHVSWTFLLEGVSRAFSHQLVRHRVGFAFSQLSQHYADQSDTHFITPFGLERNRAAFIAWEQGVKFALDSYKSIEEQLREKRRKKRVSKEELRAIRSAARSVLPNATETKIVVTANARALRHFLTVRGAIKGDIEMRLVSALIYDMIHKDAPTLIMDFKKSELADRSPIILHHRHRHAT
jgi:thymidylate synthase (FAD)